MARFILAFPSAGILFDGDLIKLQKSAALADGTLPALCVGFPMPLKFF